MKKYFLLFAIIFTALLTGCGSDEPDNNENKGISGVYTTNTFITMPTNYFEEEVWEESVIPQLIFTELPSSVDETNGTVKYDCGGNEVNCSYTLNMNYNKATLNFSKIEKSYMALCSYTTFYYHFTPGTYELHGYNFMIDDYAIYVNGGKYLTLTDKLLYIRKKYDYENMEKEETITNAEYNGDFAVEYHSDTQFSLINSDYIFECDIKDGLSIIQTFPEDNTSR